MAVVTPYRASAEQVAGMELFIELPWPALKDVAGCGRLQALPKGTVLFTQGAHAERGHALISGGVRITQSGEEGGELLVRLIGPGQMFGTVALFTDRRYPAEAACVVDSVGISWTEAQLLELIHRYPQIAVNLVGVIGARLREVQERLREIGTQRVDQRIARTLLRLAAQHSVEGQGIEIEFPLTRQDIAAMCGATLYTTSRVLTAWQKAGHISTRGRRLCILKPDDLRRLAGGAD